MPDWKYDRTINKPIQVLSISLVGKEVDALDLESGMPFSLDVNEKIDLAKIKKGNRYQATVKVFEANLTADFEREFVKHAKGDRDLLKGLDIMKETGSNLKKYELISLAPL